ncbi:unnamed protein product [Cuscuta epithymum]|uniref:Uncharacterized protein n=1 Tax=Cuscuta epithymum TaxID=186058 RepID=A0AAV0DGU7_9ASTE|nr:unnamed protein product [Cuscuta epithymum]
MFSLGFGFLAVSSVISVFPSLPSQRSSACEAGTKNVAVGRGFKGWFRKHRSRGSIEAASTLASIGGLAAELGAAGGLQLMEEVLDQYKRLAVGVKNNNLYRGDLIENRMNKRQGKDVK